MNVERSRSNCNSNRIEIYEIKMVVAAVQEYLTTHIYPQVDRAVEHIQLYYHSMINNSIDEKLSKQQVQDQVEVEYLLLFFLDILRTLNDSSSEHK